jgi:zinc transport system substrate-binding protein
LKKLFIFLFIIFIASNIYADSKYSVTASILPQKYFIEKIAGDKIEINIMVLPGNNPATYEPKPIQLQKLSKSSIYFAIGAPFEKIWLKKILSANPNMVLVKTQKNIKLKPMKHRKNHSENEILDPHIWLSPSLVKIQAENILNALINYDPVNKIYYIKNYNLFIKEVDELDNKIKNIFSNLKNKNFMVFHPSWGYFADCYGLKQIPVEVEGKTPSMKALAILIKRAKEKNIKVIFVQPQFSKKSAEIIAKQIGGKVVAVDPLAENWSENLLKVAKTFSTYLGR